MCISTNHIKHRIMKAAVRHMVSQLEENPPLWLTNAKDMTCSSGAVIRARRQEYIVSLFGPEIVVPRESITSERETRIFV